jgi:hypothetical protein
MIPTLISQLFYGLDMIFGFRLMGDGKTTKFSGHNEPEIFTVEYHNYISSI